MSLNDFCSMDEFSLKLSSLNSFSKKKTCTWRWPELTEDVALILRLIANKFVFNGIFDWKFIEIRAFRSEKWDAGNELSSFETLNELIPQFFNENHNLNFS